jgi:hypothetical protein
MDAHGCTEHGGRPRLASALATTSALQTVPASGVIEDVMRRRLKLGSYSAFVGASGGALSVLLGCSPAAAPRGNASTLDAGILDGAAPVMDPTLQDGAVPRDVAVREVGPPPPDPCLTNGGCPTGQWINVTPAAVDLTTMGTCGNYGTETVQTDPTRPQDLYTLFMCQGIWKSSNYGQTWTGPINTGANGSTVGDCAGGITVAASKGGTAPIVYAGCIRGAALGFWRSTNGGVDWNRYSVSPGGTWEQVYPPAVDPYDSDHLLIAGHAMDLLVESFDGGMTWAAVTTASGMKQNGGTGGINFINTGNAATTRTTWLWLAAQANGTIGTWRTSNRGAQWTRVETNEHLAGVSEIFQADTSGIVYMAGAYSSLGWGVLRSTDYGSTWQHVGLAQQERVVFGSPKRMYAMFGAASGPGANVASFFESGDQPGTGTWTSPATPAAMTQGPGQAAVTNDGTNSIFVVANYNAGLWRYVEPAN